jgi:hypothetical protein
MSKWLLVSELVALLLFILYGFRLSTNIDSEEWRLSREFRAQEESIQVLKRAETIQDLERAVGHLGVVVRLRDNGWVAVRYRDAHGPLWSSAVARDSKGGWFVSRVHFCGRFKQYREWREAPADREGDRDLVALERVDVEAARSRLRSLGFQPIDSPREEP